MTRSHALRPALPVPPAQCPPSPPDAAVPVHVRDTSFAALTTLGVGGRIGDLMTATTPDEVVMAVREVDAAGGTLFVLGNGSNVLASDHGFEGVVLRPATRGVRTEARGPVIQMTVQAGERLDHLVDRCVAEGLVGIECLAGIPGSVGAAPVHNVGAYGQEVAQAIVAVQAWDRHLRRVVPIQRAAARFSYRSSRFRRDSRLVILSVTFQFRRAVRSRPIRHQELAHSLDVQVGDRVPLAEVRDAVLALRRSKGMVLDTRDPDTRSAGSFFENPVVTRAELDRIQRRAHARLGSAVAVPSYRFGSERFKLPAGWLVERAGFPRGTERGAAAISSKHSLALIARGGHGAAPLIDLAREVRAGVRATFDCTLCPEPTPVGFRL